MQEIKKRRIVIASVLKPIDDTRMFEKIAVSLSDLYEVHVIGFNSAATGKSNSLLSVFTHSLGTFNRLSMRRLFTPLRVVKLAYAIRPDILIVTTHELLGAAFFLKLLTRCKIIYDVQENYARNIYYGNTVHALLRLPLCAGVRLREWLFSVFISHFFLSERSYALELGFVRSRYSVLENKLSRVPPTRVRELISSKAKINLLFSGTLATTTGVFVAIDLATKLNHEDSRIHLTIIGYASQESTRTRINNAVGDKSFIEVIGLDKLVGHQRILEKIEESDLGIICYPANPSTHTAFPTKLFEYLGYQLPILITGNEVWIEYCARYDAAIVVDIRMLDGKELLAEMFSKAFYGKVPGDVFWESEAVVLKSVVAGMVG